MKKALSLVLIISILASVLLLPVNAVAVTPYWLNTSVVVVSHGYFNGNADCAVSIDGNNSSVSVRNVTVKLQRKVGNSFFTVKTWSGLSGGQHFIFHGVVENISKNYVYRLSFTAEVVQGDVVENLSMYKDVDYRTNIGL